MVKHPHGRVGLELAKAELIAALITAGQKRITLVCGYKIAGHALGVIGAEIGIYRLYHFRAVGRA